MQRPDGLPPQIQLHSRRYLFCLLNILCKSFGYVDYFYIPFFGDGVSKLSQYIHFSLCQFLDLVRDVSYSADFFSTRSQLNCFCLVLFFIRMLKFMDFHPRLALITHTIAKCYMDLLHFGILFCCVMMGYAGVVHMFFVAFLYEFSSSSTSLAQSGFLSTLILRHICSLLFCRQGAVSKSTTEFGSGIWRFFTRVFKR